jgi:hypothetical protein
MTGTKPSRLVRCNLYRCFKHRNGAFPHHHRSASQTSAVFNSARWSLAIRLLLEQRRAQTAQPATRILSSASIVIKSAKSSPVPQIIYRFIGMTRSQRPLNQWHCRRCNGLANCSQSIDGVGKANAEEFGRDYIVPIHSNSDRRKRLNHDSRESSIAGPASGPKICNCVKGKHELVIAVSNRPQPVAQWLSLICRFAPSPTRCFIDSLLWLRRTNTQ